MFNLKDCDLRILLKLARFVSIKPFKTGEVQVNKR